MKDKKFLWIGAAVFGWIVIIWISFLIAPTLGGGLSTIIPKLSDALSTPFYLVWSDNTLPTLLVLSLIYGLTILIYHYTKPNYRRREEHGSAKWGNVKRINKRYQQKPKDSNKILSQNLSIGYDAKVHRRNFNTLVVGGSGAGKTRFYAKPNLMQANTSFVCLDPKGELLRDTGRLLKKKGYDVRVLDLINMERSDCYNPFMYIESDNDIQRLATNLFKSTTPKGSQSNDPFWDTAASMLLLALVFYLHYEAPPEEQNFAMVMELLRNGDIDEDNEAEGSVLDNKYTIVFIRGERPVLDLKYDILSHPNIKLSTDGGAPPYEHNLGVLAGGVTVEIIDPATLGDTNLANIPTVDEYFKNGIEAYNEEETEMLCEFLKSMLEEKEKSNEKKQK